jgi:flagellin-like protein
MRKSEEGVSPVIATILLVAITVVLAAVLFVMVLGLVNSNSVSLPVIGANRGSGPTNYTWTITAFEGGRSVFKSDVYVQLRANETSTFLIMTEPLSNATGTHGFTYLSATSGNYLGVGDVFSLSKDYTQGTTITLVNSDASGQYCALTV